MRYNKTERVIAEILSSFPKAKRLAKLLYQFLNYLRYKKSSSFYSVNPLIKISNTDGDPSFFGYYDRSPMNDLGSLILFYSVKGGTKRVPKKTAEIKIMVYNTKKNKAYHVGETNAFNWQQGAKLQWLDSSKVIYNDFCVREKKYYSKITDLNNKKTIKIVAPIYDVYQNYALSLNYDRLRELRPDYGYFSCKPKKAVYDHDKEGIIYVDLKTNKQFLLISLTSIINSHYKKSMDGADHLVNHIMISPCGGKFIFLHRWFLGGVRHDSLMVANKCGENIMCLEDDTMVSHCFWKSSTEIVGYLRDKKLGDKYFIINSNTKEKTPIYDLDKYGDGHPHIKNNLMITDTYPNKSRMKELIVYDFNKKDVKVIGEFYESFKFYGETRCDLHPRISDDGRYYFFDSVHTNQRHLYMMKAK